MGRLIKLIAAGRPRSFVEKSHPLGPIIKELQDVVDAHDVSIATTLVASDLVQTNAIAANAAAIVVLQGKKYTRTFPVNFASGGPGTFNLFFPNAALITRARFSVTTALAGTDDGTVQLKNNAGTDMATGLLTIPLSSALGVDVTVTPSTNNAVVAGEKVQVVTAKATAGGAGQLILEYTNT